MVKEQKPADLSKSLQVIEDVFVVHARRIYAPTLAVVLLWQGGNQWSLQHRLRPAP